MKKSTHILIVEDIAADAELAQHLIRQELKDCDFQVVETRKDFLEALETFQPDVILSDLALPSFDGITALKLTLKHAPLTPLIIWTGSSSEDAAVDCMKAGAHNYVLKENLKRLGPAILRALEEKALLVASKQAEETLLNNEKRYRALFEDLPISIWEEDYSEVNEHLDLLRQQGITDFREYFATHPDAMIECADKIRVLGVNNATLKMYHADNKDDLLKKINQGLSRSQLEYLQDAFVSIAEGKTSFVWEGTDETIAGKTIEISIAASVAPGYEKDLSKVIVAITDITERKRAEEALQNSEKRFRALIENGLDNVSLLSADGTLLWESPSSIRTLNYALNEHLGLNIFDELMHPDDLPWTRDLFTKLVQEPGSRNHTLFRLRHADGTWRWVEAIVTNLLHEPGIQAIVANYRDVNDQKLTEEALRESQIKYQNLVETSHDLIWSIDAEGGFTFVNGTAREIYGYEPEELHGRSFFEIIDPEYYQQEDFDKFSEMIAGTNEFREFETHVRHRDGRQLVLSANAIVVRDDKGKAVGVTGSSRDITLRKQAEARMNDLLAFNEKILNHSAVGILTFKVTGQCVFANEKAASIVGATVTQLLAQDFHAIPAWRESGLYDLVEEAITTRAPVTADIHHVSTFGKEVWMTAHCMTFKSKGEDHLLLSISDITEHKRAEESLRESENRLIMALSGAQMSVWEWDLQTNHILWSPEFFEITGIREDDFGKTFEAFTDLVYADDVGRLMVAAEKAVAEKTLFAEEFRIIRPDGETRWLSNLGHAEYDATRDHLRLIGTVQDITQRKQAEIERQALLEIMQGLANTKDLPELLELIHHSIGNVIYARNFFVILHDESSGLFEEIYSKDQYDSPEPPSKLEKSITSYVFRSGKPLLLTQALFDELEAQGEVELIGTDSASWLGVPLKTSGRTIGVMAVQDYENANRYSEHDQDFLVSIATQVALAIERKQADIEIQQKNDDLALLNTVNEAVVRGQNLDSIIELLSQELKRLFSSVGSTIYMLSPDKQSITMRQYSFSPEIAHKVEKLLGFAIPKIEIPVSEGGYFHRAMVSGKSAITSEPQNIQSWITEFVETKSLPPITKGIVRKLIPHIYKLLNIKSLIVVPLKSEEETIGFLNVSGTRLFNANDLKRIHHIGGQLTAVIQRQQANEKIRSSEQFLQSTQNALSASLAILNETGTIVQVNSAWREFGEQNGLVHPDSCVGLNYLDICDSATGPHAEEAALVAQAIRAIIAGQRSEARIEYPCHGPDVKRWFTLHITKFKDGDHLWVVLAHEDITERVKAEESLHESEERFSSAFEYASIGMALVSPDGRWLRVNWALCQLLGYAREELTQKTFQEITHPDDLEKDLDYVRQVLVGELDSFQMEKRYIHKLGHLIWVLLSVSLVRDHEGRPLYFVSQLQDITERKQAEAKLQTSESRYRLATQATKDVIWEWTLEHNQLIWTENAQLVFGYAAEEVGPSGLWWDEHIHPDDRDRVVSKLLAWTATGEDKSDWSDEYRLRLKDGSYAYVDDHAYLERDPGGRTIRMIGAMSNITERKRAEDAEREQRALAEALRDTAETLNSTLDYGEVLDHILTAVGRVVPHDAATIMLIDGDVARVVRSHGYEERGFKSAVMQVELLLADTTNLQQMLESGQPVVVSDTGSYPGWKRLKTTDWLCSNVGAPISINGEVIGFILLDSSTCGFFTAVHAERLEAFANQAALAIHNARLLQQAQEEIAERKRAEQALIESVNQFRSLFEASPEAIMLLDPSNNWSIIDCNPAGCLMNGYQRDELVGQCIDILNLEPGTPEEREEYLERIREQGILRYETVHRHKDGTILTLEVSTCLVKFGTRDLVLGINRDITARKQAEEDLRISEERFRQLADNIQEVFWMTDAESGEEIYLSPAAATVWGQPIERLMHEPDAFLNSVFPEDQALVLCNLEKEKKGEKVEMEYRIVRPDGSLRWVWDRAFPIFDSSGTAKRIAGITADITERKEAAEKLRESEDRYHSLFQNQVHGAALHEIITDDQGKPVDYRFLKVNPAFEKMTGLSAEKIIGHRVNEVLPGIENDHFIEIYGQVALTGEPIHISEYATPLRKYYDINAYATGPRQFAVSFMDVTERKESEMALVKSQSRYRELFDSSPISIWEEDFSLVKKRIDALMESGVTDLRQFLSSHPEMIRELASLVKIIDVNQASLELYRVNRKEGLLTSLLNILDPAYIKHFGDEIIDLVGPSKRFSWEGTDVTPDGRPLEVLVNGAIPHGYEEDWSKLIVSIIDITDRKRAEEEIRRRAEETSALLETSLALTNLDLKVTLHTISQSAKNLFAADGCRIFLMEPNGEELRCVLALQENTSAFSNLKVKIGEGVTGAVAASGRGEIVNEMQHDPRSIQVPGTLEEDEAIMFAPLKERDQTTGVLSIRRAGSNRPFQPADLELLEALASMAASAVSNARLFEEAQRRLAELEALYENGLAVGRLLKPNEIGERVISTIARYLKWHHVTIRLRREESDDLELVALSLPNLKEEERADTEQHFVDLVNKVGQGLSGWVIQTGEPFRTGNVHTHAQYVNTHAGIQSGLYMPLKVGERVIGVISVESEVSDAFTDQDERLLATLGNQVATAFENARLYHAIERELSERKRTEAALRSSEVHYRELADSITDILFELDEDLCYTHWNKASEIFSGIPAQETIGKSMMQVFGISEEQIKLEEIYRSVLKSQQARTFETEFLSHGQRRALEINAYPSARGVSVVAKDVTDRKRSEIIMQKRFELMEYSAHYSLSELMQRTVDEVSELTESTIGFFHFVQENQNTLGLQTWSTNALRLFDVPLSEGAHRGLDRAGVWAEAVRQRRPLIQNDYESLAEKKGLPKGHVPLVREIVIPIIRNERVMAVMGIGNKPQDYTLHDLEIAVRLADYAWDITERKQMQDALENERNQLAQHVEERTADLSRANSNLARALRVKDEFLANMSHELRTPLNAILGLSESLGEQIAGPLNEKQQKYITTISESGHHLLSLINDILDLAKIEAGQITLDINKMDIHSVCQASLRMIKQLAQKKNQEVLLDIEGNLGWMWADERRLKQMIVNLLSNAVKFTPENGKIGLQVHGDQDANKITITVWDNGIGIKEEDITRLFQPFIQLDSGLAREATGTGLGLALVAQMARLHGGSVSAVSDPGKGSRFSIVLPWEPALAIDTASRLRTTSKFRAIKPDETNKPTILLVEDTKEVVMMVRDYLELAGYKVVTAQDGMDALVQARHAHPDLILMDVQMPRMDGLEATRKLRSEPDFKYTPIIALTALAMPSDRERCLAAGMDEYVSKPINLKALVRIIQGCLFDRAESKPG